MDRTAKLDLIARYELAVDPLIDFVKSVLSWLPPEAILAEYRSAITRSAASFVRRCSVSFSSRQGGSRVPRG
jgi:hypothetical protein